MFKKAKKLPLSFRIMLTILLSVFWVYMASQFEIDVQTNWIISTFVIAGISSLFFPISKMRS